MKNINDTLCFETYLTHLKIKIVSETVTAIHKFFYFRFVNHCGLSLDSATILGDLSRRLLRTYCKVLAK